MSERSIPRVAVINDLVGLGRCAMTLQTSVLSCLGVQACPMPTSLLSAHSGSRNPVIAQQDHLAAWVSNWSESNAEFDGMLSGAVANREQAVQVLEISERLLSLDAPFVVDPIMGDESALYPHVGMQCVEYQRMLSGYATVITPNLTEACLLTKTQYPQGPCTNAQIVMLMRRLLDIKPKGVVVTGIPIGEDMLANACAQQGDDRISMITYRDCGVRFPGAGDLFSSTLLGRLVRGISLMQAMIFSSGWTNYAIERSVQYGAPQQEGIVIELILPLLATTGSGSPVDMRNDQTVQFLRIDD